MMSMPLIFARADALPDTAFLYPHAIILVTPLMAAHYRFMPWHEQRR